MIRTLIPHSCFHVFKMAFEIPMNIQEILQSLQRAKRRVSILSVPQVLAVVLMSHDSLKHSTTVLPAQSQLTVTHSVANPKSAQAWHYCKCKQKANTQCVLVSRIYMLLAGIFPPFWSSCQILRNSKSIEQKTRGEHGQEKAFHML